jgi:hypothetical protein
MNIFDEDDEIVPSHLQSEYDVDSGDKVENQNQGHNISTL